MRMVIFAVILVIVMIFARQGIMGRKEFSWQGLFNATTIKSEEPKSRPAIQNLRREYQNSTYCPCGSVFDSGWISQ